MVFNYNYTHATHLKRWLSMKFVYLAQPPDTVFVYFKKLLNKPVKIFK